MKYSKLNKFRKVPQEHMHSCQSQILIHIVTLVLVELLLRDVFFSSFKNFKSNFPSRNFVASLTQKYWHA
jgi:hypothetical protein